MKKLFALVLVVVMAMAFATTAFAVEKTDAISGDLTVTGFFNEKTDAVELKSGDSYTIKFNNKSNGTGWYENYVLAVVGAIGDEYTGAAQEVVIVRADFWGWGGGLSDFKERTAEEGNALPMETNIEDFPAWAAAMQAGLDCEITISRDGDTLTYDAKMGDYFVKFTATSGIVLPESLYVFLTGENCVLTGISTTKNNDAQGGDNTGDTTPDDGKGPDVGGNTTDPGNKPTGFVTVALAVTAIGSGAYIVSKKRHH